MLYGITDFYDQEVTSTTLPDATESNQSIKGHYIQNYIHTILKDACHLVLSSDI